MCCYKDIFDKTYIFLIGIISVTEVFMINLKVCSH